ncbi:MAG: methylglutaconyl-CoA hydratase [Bacteroidetes bacterium B1(2017)]|nr:MAG: methylglutaconyl-CoA hydratase [Bacteroidetes bacterium B1(2017)]
MEDLVLYEVIDRIGYLTLNRPEKRNALSFDFVNAIRTKLKQAEEDENCKVIILKSNGEAFCSGADLASLQQLQNNTYEENLADSKHLAALYLQIYQSPKIIISRVEGPAFAGGCGLATICDFCFADANARFAYTEVKIGFLPAIVMVFLLRMVGEKVARQILLTGEIFDAHKALHYNLISGVIDPSIIEEEVHQFAVKLCRNTSSQSIASTKKMLAKVPELPLLEAIDYAAQMNAQARASEDCKKGISAFLNKEKLSW